MTYDKMLLKSYTEMEMWNEYLEKNNAFAKNVSTEGFKFLEQKYFKAVKRRINHCEKLLTEYDDSCIYYTLAELYNRYNLDESAENLYKRQVRYYAIKAIRKNPDYPPLWVLLAETYSWIAELNGESKTMPTMNAYVGRNGIAVNVEHNKNAIRHKPALFFIERAVKCLEKAIAIDPQRKYIHKLREFYGLKAEELEGKEF